MEPGTPGFGSGGGGSSLPPPLQPLEVHITKWQRKYQQSLDKLTPHMYQRWGGTAGLIALFLLRIVFSQGVSTVLRQFEHSANAFFHQWYISESSGVSYLDNTLNDGRVFAVWEQSVVRPSCGFSFATVADPTATDAHAIYLLNLLLAFLQPKFDPSVQDDIMADDMEEGGDTPTPLPSSRDDEFRPFVRRLPEWQFW